MSEKEKQKISYYKNYIDHTVQLKDLTKFSSKELIKDLIEKEQIIGRQFFNENKIIKYEEILIEKNKRILANLSDQITFLYPPNERHDEKIIGFRYYKNNWRKIEDGYFTLVKKTENKYEILESQTDIKDFESNSFFMKNLNCSKIVENVIFNKYADNFDFISGLTFIEILGFIYSLKENSQEKCIITEPFIPNPSDHQSIKECFESEPIKNVLYLRPLLYLNHVSILLFTFTEKDGRKNILLEMSHFHKEYFTKDNILFPYEMKQNLLIIPKFPIQLGETCGLWFLSQVNYIIKNGINVFNEILENSTEYLIKIINEISDELKISKFLKFKSEIKSESEYEFKNFTLTKNIVFNPFLNTENFLKLPKLNYVKNKTILLKYGKKFSDSRDLIIKLQYNLNHYKILSNTSLPIDEKDIQDLKDNFFNAKSMFEELFEQKYKYYYKNENSLEKKIIQQEEDLILLFDFIEEAFKSFSDDFYIYDNEEIKKIHIGSYSYSYNKYLENFYN